MTRYDVFAITMVVTAISAVMAVLGAWLYGIAALAEVLRCRKMVERACAQLVSEQLLASKLRQAVAERVRNLETYRVHHANRLNELEDVVSLLNEDAGRMPIDASSVLQPFDVEIADHPESELFDSSMSDVDLHAMTAPTKQRDKDHDEILPGEDCECIPPTGLSIPAGR